MKNEKQTFNLNFNVQLFGKSKNHLFWCFLSQRQYRNENLNLISNFVFQSIKKTKWHFGDTDYPTSQRIKTAITWKALFRREWQSTIFGFWDLDTNEHLLLFSKMYIYNARTIGYLNTSHLLIHIKGIKDTEKKLCENDTKRRKNAIRNGKMF